jgi:hypothetical protein
MLSRKEPEFDETVDRIADRADRFIRQYRTDDYETTIRNLADRGALAEYCLENGRDYRFYRKVLKGMGLDGT